MRIERFPSDKLLSNMYVIVENKHAIIIDPYAYTDPGIGLDVDEIILTHEHYDHISGVNNWKERFSAPVLCSEACARNIASPKKNMARYFPFLCETQTWVKLDEMPEYEETYFCSAEKTFLHEYSFTWQGHFFSLFELPGHSEGGIGILLDHKYFFSGDSVLPDMETELRFPGGSKSNWETVSLPKLRELEGDIVVYPGHFDTFSLDEWKKKTGV